jgi:hypothetical protein
MASRLEARPGLHEEYVTRALRKPASQVVDPDRGIGYVLSLAPRLTDDPTAAIHLEVYPDTHALVLRTALFTLACTEVTTVRRAQARLRFTARTGRQRVGITITRSGALDVQYRDETPQLSPWQQGEFNWDISPEE